VVDQRWINTSTNTATDRFQYGYDQDDNVLYKNNLVNSSFSELYHANGSSNGYDNLNQLVAFARGTLNGSNDTISSPMQSASWSMDALGNFTSVSGTTETNNLQNEATGFGSATLTYDANGNLTTDQNGNTLVYDAWNRLVAYKNGSTVLETLSYDGLGRQIVVNPGTATDLYYSDQWQVLEERVGGSAKVQYVWSAVYVDALVLRDRDATGGGTLSERLWVQQDANWNVTALVNGSGSVVERYVYDPYGTVVVLSAAWGSLSGSNYAWIYGHQGGRLDTTTGLYYFRNRYESPALDRWVEVDPSGFAAGDVNCYRDEGNSPTNETDPAGLAPPTTSPPPPSPPSSSVSAQQGRIQAQRDQLQKQLNALNKEIRAADDSIQLTGKSLDEIRKHSRNVQRQRAAGNRELADLQKQLALAKAGLSDAEQFGTLADIRNANQAVVQLQESIEALEKQQAGLASIQKQIDDAAFMVEQMQNLEKTQLEQLQKQKGNLPKPP